MPERTRNPLIALADSPARWTLFFYVAGFVALAGAVNGIVFASGAGAWSASLTSPRFAPPGGVIGAVWVIIFASMAVALWRVRREPKSPRRAAATFAILFQYAVNLAFPFYALLPRSVLAGFVGTVVSAAIAWIVLVVVFRASRVAAAFIAPLCGWLIYAGFLSFDLYRLNG
jgi:tryptophan-rich sensory protein